uniref:Proteasome activator PA28 C-terminal domain-containing protein n=1 Tax=Anguilla anguilla TaxID=7936 RepID=A0A0E9UGT2_ANGAN
MRKMRPRTARSGVVVLDIRGFYVELYDIISKNLEKVTNPKGEEKPSMY